MRIFTVTLSIATFSSLANATPVLESLGDIGGTGGFNGVVSGPSQSSSYSNPALLTLAQEDFIVALSMLSEQISMKLDGRPGGNVPLSIGNRDVVGPNGEPIPNDVVPTRWLEHGCPPGVAPGQCPPPGFAPRPRQGAGSSGTTRGYLVLGGVKHFVKDTFSAGFTVSLPLGQLTGFRSFYNDEREALFSNSLHPEMYGDRLATISIALGASFRLLKNLELGFGLGMGVKSVADSQSYVTDSTNYDKLWLSNNVSVEASLAPIVGVAYQPIPRFRVGASAQAPSSFDIDIVATATLPNGSATTATRKEVHDFLPWRINFGVETDLIKWPNYTFSVGGGLRFAAWSAYLDRHAQAPADMYGKDMGFSDTFSGVLGVRHVFRHVRTFIDMQYVPTPIPKQIAQSNYVDNNRFGMAIGADVDFRVAGAHLRPGLQLAGYVLNYRHQTKDNARITDEVPDGAMSSATGRPIQGSQGLQTNNPGWPGFASEGVVFGGTFYVDVLMQ